MISSIVADGRRVSADPRTTPAAADAEATAAAADAFSCGIGRGRGGVHLPLGYWPAAAAASSWD